MSGPLQRVVRKPRRLLVGVVVVLPLVLAASGAEAAACKKVSGSFTLTTGAGDFAEVDTVVAGTGPWAGAGGVLRAQGTFTATAGGSGDYLGEVCTP